MQVRKYKTKPVTIEAIKLTHSNAEFVMNWISKDYKLSYPSKGNHNIIIKTLEGDVIASVGDYIIKGINGEFYPCKPDIFIRKYDEVK